MIKRQEPEGFATFWDVWRPHARHTDGRGQARETFAKHLKGGADPQDIIDGAKWFFRTMKERDRDYVPLASSWLNRGAYEDFCEMERAHQAKVAERAARQASAEPITEAKDEAMRARVRQLAEEAAKGMRSPA